MGFKYRKSESQLLYLPLELLNLPEPQFPTFKTEFIMEHKKNLCLPLSGHLINITFLLQIKIWPQDLVPYKFFYKPPIQLFPES